MTETKIRTARNLPPFVAGDVVELKSGGPLMTVFEVQGVYLGNKVRSYLITCGWFAERDQLQQDIFVAETLKAATH